MKDKKDKKEPAIVWRWRDNVRKGDDENAQAVGEELLRIANDAMLLYESLSPSLVVESARDEGSPLHGYFDWDDSHAADLYRKDQARCIIRSLGYQIVDDGEKRIYPARAVITTDDGSRVYAPVPRIVQDERLTAQMLADAIRGIEGWRSRYHDLSSTRKDLRNAFRMIDRGIDELRQAEKKKAAG